MKRFIRTLTVLFAVALAAAACSKDPVDDGPKLATFQSFCLTDGNHRLEPFEILDGKIYIMAPSGTDVSNLRAEFTHNGEKVLVDKAEQISGQSLVDFSASTAPIRYNVVSKAGYDYHYDVYLFDLPVVFIETADGSGITSRDTWMEGAHIKIIDTDGSVNVDASTSVRGRGNTTWTYPKKPYAIKLDEKSKVLGMHSDKRWNLLANWADRTLMRNTIALKISEHTKDIGWTPAGRHVELFVNGEILGDYFLCEHIKIDNHRVDITEMNTLTAVEGDDLTGGYLLEIDSHYDEKYKWRTPYRKLPFMIKQPDENVRDVQVSYIKNYVNNLEEMLHDEKRLAAREYADYLDIDSFIDYFLVHELAEYAGPADDAYSSHMYKDRLGKIKAGPVWDFDRTTFKPNVTKFLNKDSALWYEYLFEDPVFVARLKEKWAESKPDFEAVVPEIDSVTAAIRRSANFTLKMWPTTSTDNGDESMTFDKAAARLKSAYSSRITTLDKLINAL